MHRIFFVLFIVAVVLGFGLVQVILMRKLNPEWWRRRWIRRASWSLPIIGVTFLMLFIASEYYLLDWLRMPSSIVSVTAVVLELGLMIALPFSGLLHGINRWLDRREKHTDEPANMPAQSRRWFLKTTAAAVPVAALATGLTGIGRAFAEVRVYKRQMAIKGLPPALEGLRILHLSDTHLRHYVTVEDLEQVLSDAAAHSPELILLTGDIADDVQQLPQTIEMVLAMRPEYGAYAIMGNHEYFRGPRLIKQLYAESTVPLMIDESRRLNIRGQQVLLAGIDDPVRLGGVGDQFFISALDKALVERQNGEFTILMSHRPDVFPHAASRSVHLTLAGHTHGGQVGAFGRSLLESAFPQKYLWGEYTMGDSRLYTSCGAGHWFPFRLGCPAEAPVIELVSA